MSGGNLLKRLVELLPSDPLWVGDVSLVHGDGTVTVTLLGGGQLRVRDPLVSAEGARVFVQAGAVTGPAPNLPFGEIEI